MADNTTLNSGAGGDVIATDDVAGVKYPRTKIQTGADGVAGGDVTSTNPLDVRIGDATVTASVFPAGFFRVSDEPRQLFYDPFDAALDTTARWSAPVTTNSGVAASVSAGVLTLGTGTVANGTSVLLSQPSFTPTIPAWLGASFAIKVESPPVINGTRFWGVGTKPATPAAGAMVTDGYGFELDAAGKLFAVVYAAGVRTAVQDFSAATGNAKQPTDALYHRYIVYYRTDRIYWYIDSLTVACATSSFQSPTVQTLPVNMTAVGNATPPVTSDSITCTGLAVWDTGKNNTQLSDGTFPWRKSTISLAAPVGTAIAGLVVRPYSPTDGTNTTPTMDAAARRGFQSLTDGTSTAAVKAASTAAIAADASLVVALHPTSPVPLPTLTKGTQGTTGVSVQRLIDAGRVYVCYTATALTAATAEALVSLTPYRDLVAGGAATTHAVTSGKRLRLQTLVLTLRATSTVNVGGLIRLRLLAGTVLVGSPVHAAIGTQCSNLATAVIGNALTMFIDLPDGLELSGTMQLGITQLCSAATATLDVQLIGFEY